MSALSRAQQFQITEGAEFPVRSQIFDEESGHGYALRMTEANHVGGIPALKKWLGKSRFTVLDDADAELIAGWFGADPPRVATALGNTGKGRKTDEFQFAGQTLDRSYFVNRMYPRVCGFCLRRDGFCKSAWDIALSTVCPRDGVILQERCEICGTRLSWQRPSIDVCQCGWKLSDQFTLKTNSPLELEVSSWILGRISDIEIPAAEVPLARLLKPLTLVGGLHLIYALGTAARYSDEKLSIPERRKSSVGAAQTLLIRANHLVESIARGEAASFRVAGQSAIVHLLAESASAKAGQADRSLAHSLIGALLHRGGRSNWASKFPQLSQRELF